MERRMDEMKADESVEEEVKNMIQEIYKLETNLRELIEFLCILKLVILYDKATEFSNALHKSEKSNNELTSEKQQVLSILEEKNVKFNKE